MHERFLSATPYKMYTVADEAGGDDHYRDFVDTLKFLFNDEAVVLVSPLSLAKCGVPCCEELRVCRTLRC